MKTEGLNFHKIKLAKSKRFRAGDSVYVRGVVELAVIHNIFHSKLSQYDYLYMATLQHADGRVVNEFLENLSPFTGNRKKDR